MHMQDNGEFFFILAYVIDATWLVRMQNGGRYVESFYTFVITRATRTKAILAQTTKVL
jgi:hypothetical protein